MKHPKDALLSCWPRRSTGFGRKTLTPHQARFVPFSAQTRMSGVDILEPDGSVAMSIRKGAVDSMREYLLRSGGSFPEELEPIQSEIARSGGTPLAVSIDNQALGIVHLKDVVKGGIKERFAELRKMGIRTVMVTGDNPLTAAAIAAEAGVDDFIAQATPETKLERIREEQRQAIWSP